MLLHRIATTRSSIVRHPAVWVTISVVARVVTCEISGNISSSLEVITSITFIRIR